MTAFRPIGKKTSPLSAVFGNVAYRRQRCLYGSAAVVLALASWSNAYGLPASGVVSAGAATIATSQSALTINQSSQNAVINWQSFSIGQDEAVRFVQPNSNSVALNRVLGSDPSNILGSLSANGKVFLVNPNGILFGAGAQVNVAGLVASTLDITDVNFMNGQYSFSGAGTGAVLNRGSINADGGYVALLGASVSNEGVIAAKFGTVALAAGNAVTLDVAGDGLLNVTVDQGALNALVENGGMIRADGGQVVMTAQAAGALLKTVVNNTGVIEAQTIENRNGTIKLLGDMQAGTVNVSGTLDASAPNGGDGGSVEASSASVNIADQAKITTAAPMGTTGTFLIDPQDFTVAAGSNISGAALSALLVTNSVTISTLAGDDATVAGTPPVTSLHTTSPGNGDINVNEAVTWTASPSTTTLTLNADRDVNVNQAVTATNGNFVVCCGRDVNVNAAITTTNGSVLLSGGRNVIVNSVAALVTTDGNITLCAGLNVDVNGAITLTRGTTFPAQSLGLKPGLYIIAGYGGTGPGVAGGTLIFAPLAPSVVVTGPNAPVEIDYNPPNYATQTNYSGQFTLTGGSIVTERMLLFPNGDKVADGTTATTLTSFNSSLLSGAPTGVTLVANPGSSATFDDPNAGSNIGITYSGYSLGGPDAANYALALACCVSTFRTTGTITAAEVTPISTPTPPGTPTQTPPDTTPPPDTTTPPGTTTQTPPSDTSTSPPDTSTPTSSSNSTSTSSSTPMTTPQASELPPAAISVPGGFTLAVLGGGIRMPVFEVADTIPNIDMPVLEIPDTMPAQEIVDTMPVIPELALTVPEEKEVYQAPVYQPKQDRN